MAQGSTVIGFELVLSDVDRGVYESLSFKVAQHPSETAVYLATRVLAYALEWAEGIEFSQGLCTADVPAIAVTDRTGQLQTWIEIGTPDAPRLHRASKAAPRVAVYCHKNAQAWLRGLAGHTVHAPETINLFRFDATFIDAVSERIERRNAWSLSVTEGALYLDLGADGGRDGESLVGSVERLSWP
ncbi:MAG: YaeQ family protein [Deltaproteobacteria bacterium]|nr:YaeQ family protein [Deltaproteobacteria bacterium]